MLARYIVFWTPYSQDELEELELSHICRRDAELWRTFVPLIFYFVVELHLPHRVNRQFSRLQDFPPEAISTSQALHRYVVFNLNFISPSEYNVTNITLICQN